MIGNKFTVFAASSAQFYWIYWWMRALIFSALILLLSSFQIAHNETCRIRNDPSSSLSASASTTSIKVQYHRSIINLRAHTPASVASVEHAARKWQTSHRSAPVHVHRNVFTHTSRGTIWSWLCGWLQRVSKGFTVIQMQTNKPSHPWCIPHEQSTGCCKQRRHGFLLSSGVVYWVVKQRQPLRMLFDVLFYESINKYMSASTSRQHLILKLVLRHTETKTSNGWTASCYTVILYSAQCHHLNSSERKKIKNKTKFNFHLWSDNRSHKNVQSSHWALQNEIKWNEINKTLAQLTASTSVSRPTTHFNLYSFAYIAMNKVWKDEDMM